MTVALRKTTIQKEKLSEIIFEHPDSVQRGLRFIDRDVSIGECGVIDFLGADAAGGVIILNIDTEENAETLVSVLSQVQWMKKYKGIMDRLLTGKNVDPNSSPRVLLVAPAFPDKLKEALRQVPGIDMKLIAFEYFIAGKEDAIAFEEILHTGRYEQDSSSSDGKSPEDVTNKHSFDPACQPGKTLLAYKQVSLTAEEVGEFIDYGKHSKGDKIAE